jgi:hypothetical protein
MTGCILTGCSPKSGRADEPGSLSRPGENQRIVQHPLVSFDDPGRRRDDFTDVSTCVTGESGGAQRLELECFIFEDEFHDLRLSATAGLCPERPLIVARLLDWHQHACTASSLYHADQ